MPRPFAKTPKFTFGFLDETGTLGGARDPFFAVGLLRCAEPYELLRPMQRIRDRHHFYDEVKWNKVSAKKLPLLRTFVDVFFSCDASFSAFVTDKRAHDVIGRSGARSGPTRRSHASLSSEVFGRARFYGSSRTNTARPPPRPSRRTFAIT